MVMLLRVNMDVPNLQVNPFSWEKNVQIQFSNLIPSTDPIRTSKPKLLGSRMGPPYHPCGPVGKSIDMEGNFGTNPFNFHLSLE